MLCIYMCVCVCALVLEPQLIRYYNRELNASYNIYKCVFIYANAIKTLHDISPHFKRAVILYFAWCFFFFRYSLPLHWWYVSSVHSFMRSFVCLCKYFLFAFVQHFTVCRLPRFINVNEFSSAVSHISKFFSYFIAVVLQCIRQFRSLNAVCVCVSLRKM